MTHFAQIRTVFGIHNGLCALGDNRFIGEPGKYRRRHCGRTDDLARTGCCHRAKTRGGTCDQRRQGGAGHAARSLDRVAAAVDGAESSHGKDIAMWRPDPSGPQGPMQVGEASATDVGGGDRFDLSQNRAIGRAYLALLYGRYKNWPDAITAYNWGLSNVDTWIKVGRPPEKLIAPVAAYTTRVLYHSGLCYSTQIIQRRRSANFKDEPGFRAAIADPLNHTVLGNSDTAGGTSTGNERYPCATVPSSSKPGPSRLNQDATPSQSLLEQMTASQGLVESDVYCPRVTTREDRKSTD